jgi:ribosomal protein L11 methyltransferase
MNHLRVTISVRDHLIREMLLAWLIELGYEGFEEQEDVLQAYVPEASFDPAALELVLARQGLTYSTDTIPEKNWNEEWEKNFDPVLVDDFCAIRAYFHPPSVSVSHDLIITPKMSFGTGHHATTYMMLQAMRELHFPGQSVLDFGTGTGVLAILADKLGASSVLAIDNDDWSIENARENITENRSVNVSLSKSDHVPAEIRPDIILANINKHILLGAMGAMAQQLRVGGVILLSGLLLGDSEGIENEAAICGLSTSKRMTRGSWICLKMEKTKLSG